MPAHLRLIPPPPHKRHPLPGSQIFSCRDFFVCNAERYAALRRYLTLSKHAQQSHLAITALLRMHVGKGIIVNARATHVCHKHGETRCPHCAYFEFYSIVGKCALRSVTVLI